MPEKYSQGTRTDGSRVSRRTFVKAAGASGAAVSLAGCIYGDDGDGEDAVVFGFDPDSADDVGDEIVQLFYDNGLDEDIDVELQPGASDTGERRDNYETLLDTGETEPDIMLMDNGWVNVFIQRGLIANLSEVLEDDEVSRIDDEYFEAFTDTARDPDSDELYGVPLFPDFGTMQYRKDYAREAGYDDDDFEEWATEPMSWEEWSQITAEMVEESDANFGLSTQMAIYEGTSCCSFNEVLTSWGGGYFGGEENLFGPVGERDVTVDEEEFVDALRMLRTFVDGDDENALEDYEGDLAPSDITQWSEDESLPQMENGSAAMHRNWPYAIVNNAEEFGVDNYGTMPIPYAVSEDEAAQDGMGGTASALGGWHIVMNPNSERQEESLEVIRAAMEDDFNLGLLDLWGWLPPKPELFDSQEAEDLEPIGNYMDTLRVAGENAVARPVTEVWGTQSELIAQEVNSAVAGNKSPQEAAEDLQSGLEDTES
ncbi:extracellular solute-binding protein [Halobacteria archaeon AArc-m2/3/4]|uniref:Extracellular solute-binding protein n=1 Tax=Natronoglomus mannanivorans TaxID=2979990 RepID=A0AAP3E0M6_9EURY|nr:extracellular solute-binding protein [Halobacteria archaeon AArc-xg1-1]MCU4971351.1 extracellular solute-binding protein [Halobacteria archaeon AArc-m2/3/4]